MSVREKEEGVGELGRCLGMASLKRTAYHIDACMIEREVSWLIIVYYIHIFVYVMQ